MTKVHMIIPVIMEQATMLERMEPYKQFGFHFSESRIAMGPHTIESEFDELFAGPPITVEALKAQEQGAGAVIIACMGDPGLHAAREAVSIPVIGPGEAAMHMAAMMGHRFTVIPTLSRRIPTYQKHARLYGVADYLASVRPADIRVQDIETPNSGAPEKLLQAGRLAVEQDHADVLILGCMGFDNVKKMLEKELGVPVIDPLAVAINLAGTYVRSGLSHSKKAFPNPLAKLFKGYGDFEFNK